MSASRLSFGREPGLSGAAFGLSGAAFDLSTATFGFSAVDDGLSAADPPFGLSVFLGLLVELVFGLSLVFKATASYHAASGKTRFRRLFSSSYWLRRFQDHSMRLCSVQWTAESSHSDP